MARKPTDGTAATAACASRAVQVFTGEVLDILRERDEPPTALDAEVSGPWEIVPVPPRGFGVTRRGDPEFGTEPYARFRDRHPALLTAAALPGLARTGTFRVDPTARALGYPLLRQGEEIGLLRVFAADLAPALDAFDALLRSPEALARLLEAAGVTALERAGNLLGLRLVVDEESEER